MQVTHDIDRVTRSVVVPVCAYLVLLHMYSGKDAGTDASNQEGASFGSSSVLLKMRCKIR